MVDTVMYPQILKSWLSTDSDVTLGHVAFTQRRGKSGVCRTSKKAQKIPHTTTEEANFIIQDYLFIEFFQLILWTGAVQIMEAASKTTGKINQKQKRS